MGSDAPPPVVSGAPLCPPFVAGPPTCPSAVYSWPEAVGTWGMSSASWPSASVHVVWREDRGNGQRARPQDLGGRGRRGLHPPGGPVHCVAVAAMGPTPGVEEVVEAHTCPWALFQSGPSACVSCRGLCQGGRSCHSVRAMQTLGVYLGSLLVTLRDLREGIKTTQKLWDLLATTKSNRGRQVLCLQLNFFRVLWAVWMGASWDGAPVCDH